MSYWYGLSFQDIARMPQAAIQAYLNQLPTLQAEWNWMLSNASAFPHLEPHGRDTLIAQWQATMQPSASEPARRLTARQKRIALQVEATRLAMIGIGTQLVAPQQMDTQSFSNLTQG